MENDHHHTQHPESTDRGTSSKKNLKYVTYSCTKCSKLDIQISICLKTIQEMLVHFDDGFTDYLDRVDPVVSKLFEDRGYKERRRKPKAHKTRSRSPKRIHPASMETAAKNAKDSGLTIKLPCLSEPELFGDPEVRWSETFSIVQTAKNLLALNGSEGKKTLILDAKEGRIVDRVEHGIPDIYNYVEYRGHQLYFQANGKIVLYRGNERLIQTEEKWQTESKAGSGGRIVFLTQERRSPTFLEEFNLTEISSTSSSPKEPLPNSMFH